MIGVTVRFPVLMLMLAALASCPGLASGQSEEGRGEDAPSVLVDAAMPEKGSLELPVTAYGLAQPAPGAAMSVSSLHAAQILRLRVVAGQVVRQGEALLDLGADPAASLAAAQALSDLKLAQGELARTRQMLAERLATNSQLEAAIKAASDAEATVKARQREGGGKPIESVTAPIAGVVTTVAISNGDHVQPGTTLLDIAAGGGGTGILGVRPGERPRVKAGQSVHLIDLDAPDAPIEAVVTSVGGIADPKTGLFTVVATPVENTPGPPSGAHLRGLIETGGIAGWLVPRDAVLTDDRGPYVFQIAGGKAARVEIRIEGAAGEQLAISGAIDPQHKIVISGNYQLSDGSAVHEGDGPAQAGSSQNTARSPSTGSSNAGQSKTKPE